MFTTSLIIAKGAPVNHLLQIWLKYTDTLSENWLGQIQSKLSTATPIVVIAAVSLIRPP